MGLGGISIWQLLIILAIVVMLFGTKRLRNVGSDLGSAVKGFRNSLQSDEDEGQSTGPDKGGDSSQNRSTPDSAHSQDNTKEQ